MRFRDSWGFKNHAFFLLNQMHGKNIMKPQNTLSILVAMAAIAVPAYAQNLVKNGDAENGSAKGWSPLPTVSTEAHGGLKSFIIKTSAKEYCSDLIEINPETHYELTGYFKSAGKATVHFGLQPYDEQGRRINSVNINRLPNTETVLTAGANRGDTTLLIANGEAWKADPKWAAVAFHVDDTADHTDLPNFKISSLGITEVSKSGDHWEVVLASPLTAAYPGGTKVALHLSSAGNMYVVGSPQTIGTKWSKITGTINGMGTGVQGNKFWPGTALVKVVLIVNTNGADTKDALFFDDIVLNKVSN